MNWMKRLTAIALCGALVASLAGCSGADTTWIAKYGDTKLPAGVYIATMMDVYSEAKYRVPDQKGDLLSQQIDEVNADEWICNETMNRVKEHIAIDQLFDEMGLSFTEEQQKQIDDSFTYQWGMLQKIYELNGVGETSLKLNLENNAKVNVLFQAIYGKDGTKAVSDEELLDKIEQDYAKTQYILLSKVDNTGTALPEDKLATVKELAESYLARAQAGEKILDLILEEEKRTAENPDDVHSHEDETIHDALVSKENSNFPKEFVEAIFQKELNEPFLVETEEYLFVATRLSVRDEKMLESLRNTALLSLKSEEFQKDLEDRANSLENVTINEGAVNRYTPKKIRLG